MCCKGDQTQGNQKCSKLDLNLNLKFLLTVASEQGVG